MNAAKHELTFHYLIEVQHRFAAAISVPEMLDPLGLAFFQKKPRQALDQGLLVLSRFEV
ncbi:MAG TPA: hypothetical protein VEF34_04520 [Syntrophobacteraceae bacterium]|nr:hypothetical protein [Syntrophobacteraceae bacterium]